jgi:hypothetical protein
MSGIWDWEGLEVVMGNNVDYGNNGVNDNFVG